MEKIDTNEFRELTTEEIGMVSGAGTLRQILVPVFCGANNVDYSIKFIND